MRVTIKTLSLNGLLPPTRPLRLHLYHSQAWETPVHVPASPFNFTPRCARASHRLESSTLCVRFCKQRRNISAYKKRRREKQLKQKRTSSYASPAAPLPAWQYSRLEPFQKTLAYRHLQNHPCRCNVNISLRVYVSLTFCKLIFPYYKTGIRRVDSSLGQKYQTSPPTTFASQQGVDIARWRRRAKTPAQKRLEHGREYSSVQRSN